MDLHRLKLQIKRKEKRHGKKLLKIRRKFNRMVLRAGAEDGVPPKKKKKGPKIKITQDITEYKSLQKQFSEYLKSQTDEWKKTHSYLLNGDLSAPSFDVNKKLGDNLNQQGDVYDFDNGRDGYVIKIGPEGELVNEDPHYKESLSSNNYFENFVNFDTRYLSKYPTGDDLPDVKYSVFENGEEEVKYLDKKPCPPGYQLKEDRKIKVTPTAREHQGDGIYKFVCKNQGKTEEKSSKRIYAHPVEIQNIIAKEGKAPKVVGAGLFKGHRITVMEKIKDAKTLNQSKKDGTKRSEIMKSFAELMKSKGFCHQDIHTKNIVYGNLNDEKKQWYLIDFDASFHLRDKGKFKNFESRANKETKHCNDQIHTQSQEVKKTDWDTNATEMPPATKKK